MILDFKNWLLDEVGTGTNAVATFSRPIMGEPIRRTPKPCEKCKMMKSKCKKCKK